jgi:hypothetical protein
MSNRGLVMSARLMASICCSPPESSAAMVRRRSRSGGNSVSTRSSVQTGRAACRCRGDEVFMDRQIGNHLPALRHQTQAVAGDPIWGQSVEARAAKTHLSGGRPENTHHGGDGGGLAHAVAAEQCRHFAGLHGQVTPNSTLVAP